MRGYIYIKSLFCTNIKDLIPNLIAGCQEMHAATCLVIFLYYRSRRINNLHCKCWYIDEPADLEVWSSHLQLTYLRPQDSQLTRVSTDVLHTIILLLDGKKNNFRDFRGAAGIGVIYLRQLTATGGNQCWMRPLVFYWQTTDVVDVVCRCYNVFQLGPRLLRAILPFIKLHAFRILHYQ